MKTVQWRPERNAFPSAILLSPLHSQRIQRHSDSTLMAEVRQILSLILT